MGDWLITGAGGLLGGELAGLLRARGERVTALARADLDVCDQDAVRDAVARHTPDVVVNCAAWTAVDTAEGHQARALAVNATAVAGIATACGKAGVPLVHLSTDYVFGAAAASTPYREDAAPAPCNAYGRGKLDGERAVLGLLPGTGYVVRTGCLYGSRGRNFVSTMMRLADEREGVEVVDDQTCQPTWARDLADALHRLHVLRPPAGVYHATSTGRTTWYELAREVYALLGADPRRVRPIAAARLAGRAPRPAYSVLAHDRWTAAGLPALPHWRTALHAAFPELAAAHRAVPDR